jgi:16S rRNA processing protein RimM
MRVESLTDRPAERFTPGTLLYPEGTATPLTIDEARPADPGWVLRFREVPSREAAEAFRLVYLEVETGPGDELPSGSYYWHEMVDVAVRDPAGAELGSVRDVYRAGGADVLVVRGGPRGDFDLPIARPFVRVLEPRRGEIVADPEALDLPAAGSLRPPAPPRPPRPRRATRRRPAVPAEAPPPGPSAMAAEGAPPAAEAHDPGPRAATGDGRPAGG